MLRVASTQKRLRIIVEYKYLEFVSNSCHLEYQDGEGRLIIVTVVIDILVVIHTVIGSGTPLSLRLLLLRAAPRRQDRD